MKFQRKEVEQSEACTINSIVTWTHMNTSPGCLTPQTPNYQPINSWWIVGLNLSSSFPVLHLIFTINCLPVRSLMPPRRATPFSPKSGNLIDCALQKALAAVCGSIMVTARWRPVGKKIMVTASVQQRDNDLGFYVHPEISRRPWI
jgi:hypothetical protein